MSTFIRMIVVIWHKNGLKSSRGSYVGAQRSSIWHISNVSKNDYNTVFQGGQFAVLKRDKDCPICWGVLRNDFKMHAKIIKNGIGTLGIARELVIFVSWMAFCKHVTVGKITILLTE